MLEQFLAFVAMEYSMSVGDLCIKVSKYFVGVTMKSWGVVDRLGTLTT